MTNDMITLTCPTCGGKLEFSQNTTSLVCPHCGNEHLIRREQGNISLESYARCPVCGRNDEVKKVSAILTNQTQSMNGVTIEKHSYHDKDGNLYTSTSKVPFTGTQASVLAIKLQPPVEPKPKQKGSIRPSGCLSSSAILFLIALPIGFFSVALGYGGTTLAWVLGFSSVILGLFLLVQAIRVTKKEKVELAAEVKQIREQDYPKWKKAIERWKKLYYCFRDDCIFIPGEATPSEPGLVDDYVYLNK